MKALSEITSLQIIVMHFKRKMKNANLPSFVKKNKACWSWIITQSKATVSLIIPPANVNMNSSHQKLPIHLDDNIHVKNALEYIRMVWLVDNIAVFLKRYCKQKMRLHLLQTLFSVLERQKWFSAKWNGCRAPTETTAPYEFHIYPSWI